MGNVQYVNEEHIKNLLEDMDSKKPKEMERDGCLDGLDG